MSDEKVEKSAAATNENKTGEENANNESENGESTKEPKKFSVLKVKFGPELDDPPADTASDDPNEPSSPSIEERLHSPLTPEHFTYGYATNEAIPMTIFYRSQHSQGYSGKQRPTLQELRKGLENDKVRKCSLSTVAMNGVINQVTFCVLFSLAHFQLKALDLHIWNNLEVYYR